VYRTEVFVVLVSVLLLIPYVASQEVKIEKSIKRNKLKMGEEVKIEILIRNSGTKEVIIDVIDTIDRTTFSVASTDERGVYNETSRIYDFIVWKKLNLLPGETERLYYLVKVIKEVEDRITLPPAKVLYNGKIVYSNEPEVFIVGKKGRMVCVINGRCESDENYMTCPKDCPSGSRDGYCDGVEDGICDPDCVRFSVKVNDVDCRGSSLRFIIYISIITVIIVFTVLIYKRVKAMAR